MNKNYLIQKNLLHIFSEINAGMYIVDTHRKILFWNNAAEKITGFSKSDVLNRYCYDNILQRIDGFGNKLCIAGCPLQTAIEDDEKQYSKVYLHHKNGYRVSVDVKSIPIHIDNNVVGAVEIFSDNTNNHTALENINELKTIAFRDELTKLYNRRYCQIHLEHKLQEYKNFNINFGIVFFDIDNFKYINDSYGHLIGDEILKMIGQTSNSVLEENDFLSRWGGEEFVLAVQNVNFDRIKSISEKLRRIIDNSNINYEKKKLSVTVSIGATIINEDDTIHTLIDRADMLMYRSKTNGKNQVTIG